MFDRTIKPYILILTLIFAVSFLAGTLAPSSIRQQMTEVFQAVVGNYQGLAGGMLFFNILVQNVMATIFVLISGVFGGSSRHSPSAPTGLAWVCCSVRQPRCPVTRRRRSRFYRTGYRDPGASHRGLLRTVARRDGRPEDAGEGKHAPQNQHRACLPAVLRRRVPSSHCRGDDRDGPDSLAEVGKVPRTHFP